MAFDIDEIMQKLKAIEGFAKNVSETKKLADDLAKNFASMKTALTNTMNESFTEIAQQIEELRKNMERMEEMGSVEAATAAAEPKPSPTPEPTPKPPEPEPEVQPEPQPTQPTPEEATVETPDIKPEEPETPPVEPKPEEPVEEKAATLEPESQADTTVETKVEPEAPEPAEESGELDLLLQEQDQVKAKLTDLRFDYMRGYIPEEEYKEKESELDSKLEELDKKIADLK